MHEAARRLLQSGQVEGRTAVHRLHSALDADEASCLAALIASDPSIVRTLEVGCAYGVSALTIAGATTGRPGARHTMLDPHQHTEWDDASILALERAGLLHAELVEQRSELALPALLPGQAGTFQLILLDGWHTFDQVLLEGFYAARLLAVGGYLAFDDVTFPAVRRAVDELLTWPCFTFHTAVALPQHETWRRRAGQVALGLLPRRWAEVALAPAFRRRIEGQVESFVVLRKVSEDTRAWNWDGPRAWNWDGPPASGR